MALSDNHHPIRRFVLGFVAVVLIFGAVYSGALFFQTVRALVAQTSAPAAESVVVMPGQAVQPEQQSAAEPQELPDVVQAQGRVNVLLLGIDQRADDPGPYRTDTMILVSMDPATNTAAMLSIPRDLWVTIPGYGENRINTAHLIGDAQDYPGGGVALAQKTVWYALGVPVHYYVRINFDGFERLVDAIGGITVDVKQAIHDKEYPDGHYGIMTIDIPAGVQQMDGQTALQYARSRHGTGDFDRMGRQQAVILAARDKALSLAIPLSSLPKMLDIAGDSVKTNLSIKEMYALAEMVRELSRDDIRYGVIDDSMTTTVITPQGWMVEVPEWDNVRVLVDELFPAPPLKVQPTPSLARAQLASEGARIALQNGTLVTDLAKNIAQTLRDQSFNVIRYDNADRFDHTETLLIAYGDDKPYTVSAVAEQLGVVEGRIFYQDPAGDDVDILVILGRDQTN